MVLYTANVKRGFFITLEGLDGSGKTTQHKRLAAWLTHRGTPPVVTRQPGGTAIGDRIRALLLDAKTRQLSPLAELGLMFSDRAQTIAEVIAPALAEGRVVICDRFTDSTEAYQGGGRELGSDIVLALHRELCRGLNPDLTLLLLPDFSQSLARARRRNERTALDENRFEQEDGAFYERVLAKYREIAVREPLRVVVVDGNLSIEEVHARIVQVVAERLHAHHSPSI